MIRVGSLDPADPATDLIQADSSAIYASGHVLFARDETLMAQPFDAHARQPTGEPFPLAEQISREGSRYVSASVSENGTLVYGRGVSAAGQRLTWFDRAGRVLGTLGEAASYDPALSPEERRVAVALGTGSPGNLDIWIVDIARNVPSRQTSDPGVDLSPVWSPDGARIAFGSRRSGKTSLRHRSIDGTAPDESLVEDGSSDLMILPSDWSADGRFIAYTLSGAFPRRSDVWVLPLFGDRKPVPVAQTGFLEAGGVLSPDGRWIAYTTDEGGQPNVSVQAFLRPGGRHPVSREGGSQPSWRADGKELFYLGLDGTLMAVAIDAIGDFTAGVPQALFQAGAPTFNFATSVMTSGTSQSYAVTKDGQRFLVNAKPAAVAPLTVLLNWPAAAATQR
jgi:dipeptidyl aminopeptidase/acylaminoacyl peptidase